MSVTTKQIVSLLDDALVTYTESDDNITHDELINIRDQFNFGCNELLGFTEEHKSNDDSKDDVDD